MRKKSPKKIEEEFIKERRTQCLKDWDECYKKFLEKGYFDRDFLNILAEKMRMCNEVDREIFNRGYRHLYEKSVFQ
jgi:hypothetical protein